MSRDNLSALLLGLALFAVYAVGACHTIYVGDSGELTAAVYLLGIPHPTGYPLYIMLGKLWTLLVPLGSIAYRMSLFSAVCGAIACGALYRLARMLDVRPSAALLSALLLAFAPSFWAEANVQRVYTLNAIFVVAATAAAVRWYRRRDAWALMVAFLLCGIGATNHTFMAVYAVALALFVFATNPRIVLRPLLVLGLGVAFAVGLLPYAYLPIRSLANPALDWGNPETLHNFLDVVLRRGFWERAWLETPVDLIPIAWDYLRSFGPELAWAGAALAVVGLVVGWRRRVPVLLILLVMAGNLAALALHGSRSDIFIWHRYYIPSYAMAALLAGVGAQALFERLPRPVQLVPLAIPLFLLVTGWRANDRSRYEIADAFSRGVLHSLPPGAHLIATDDNILFVLIYLHFVENERPDVDLILQGVGGNQLPPLRFNPESEPLFFTHHPNWNLQTLDIVPVGLVFRAWRRDQPPLEPVFPLADLPGADDPDVPRDYLTQNLVGQFYYMRGFTYEKRDWPRARREFAAAAAASPENDVLFYNLGLIYARNGLYEDAIKAFERSYEINPRHLASLQRPQASDRITELRDEQQRLARMEQTFLHDLILRAARQGTPTWHRRMAQILDARGEPTAARGHWLRAEELEAEAKDRADLRDVFGAEEEKKATTD